MDGIAANQTSQSPLHLRITDGNLTATLGTFQFESQVAQLVANATNYVFLDLSQEPPLLTVNQSGFPTSAVWTIATAVTNDTQITQLTDSRPAFNSLAFSGGGGTPGGATTQLQYNNAGAFGGIAESEYVSGTGLNIGAPGFGIGLAGGPTESNAIAIISATGVEIDALETSATFQLNSDSDIDISSNNGDINLSTSGASFAMTAAGSFALGNAPTNKIGFYGTTAVVRPIVTGAKAGNTAVTLSILAALAALGLITDSTT